MRHSGCDPCCWDLKLFSQSRIASSLILRQSHEPWLLITFPNPDCHCLKHHKKMMIMTMGQSGHSEEDGQLWWRNLDACYRRNYSFRYCFHHHDLLLVTCYSVPLFFTCYHYHRLLLATTTNTCYMLLSTTTSDKTTQLLLLLWLLATVTAFYSTTTSCFHPQPFLFWVTILTQVLAPSDDFFCKFFLFEAALIFFPLAWCLQLWQSLKRYQHLQLWWN